MMLHAIWTTTVASGLALGHHQHYRWSRLPILYLKEHQIRKQSRYHISLPEDLEPSNYPTMNEYSYHVPQTQATLLSLRSFLHAQE